LIDGDQIGMIDLDPQDFFIERHRWIFEAMTSIEGKVDYLTVSDALKNAGKLKEVEGDAFLTRLINNAYSSQHAAHYAEIIKGYGQKRRDLETFNKAARDIHSEKGLDRAWLFDALTKNTLVKGQVPEILNQTEDEALWHIANTSITAAIDGVIAKHHLNEEAIQYAQTSYKNPNVADFINFPNEMLTIILTALLTPDAIPVDALGYKGIPQKNHLFYSPKLFQTPQKNPQGQDLCVDHSAMKIPSRGMMEFVYKRQLMQTIGLGFSQFGTWPNIGKTFKADS